MIVIIIKGLLSIMSTFTYLHIAQKRKIYMNVHIIHKAGTSPQEGRVLGPGGGPCGGAARSAARRSE